MASIVTRRRTGPKRLLPAGALPFRRRLLSWYGRHRRRLPWRGVRDPYAVLVSEIMLQQTQVARVLQFYPRFLARYPTLEDLAAAPADAVRESWDGLGYYARARSLHAAAGAVASLAFGADVPAVDTNAARVLARVFAVRGRRKSARRERRVWALAAALVPRGRAADWNQALMDLGATYCVARAPRCRDCPVRRSCATGRTGADRRRMLPTAEKATRRPRG